MPIDAPPPLGTTPDELELRELVAHAKQDLPSSSQLNTLATRLGPILAGSALVAASSATGAAAAAGKGVAAAAQATLGATALKVGGAAVLAATIAGGTYWAASETNPSPPTRSATSQTHSAPQTPLRAEPPAPAQSAPEAVPAPAPEPSSKVRTVPAQPNRAPAPRAADESTLLRQAQSQLKSNPARALALTQEHRRQFPNGALAQEREVIAIDALARLGQGSEAQKRARDFDERYPGSAHRRKVESATKPGP
ncbi:MAG TPA: hypothetical protein VI072_06230 [Polyangiaceae bacterium]